MFVSIDNELPGAPDGLFDLPMGELLLASSLSAGVTVSFVPPVRSMEDNGEEPTKVGKVATRATVEVKPEVRSDEDVEAALDREAGRSARSGGTWVSSTVAAGRIDGDERVR